LPPPRSAGILLFRRAGRGLEVLLIKPGGPFWRNKDAGAWMIPKGAFEPGESALDTALREFEEETGTRLDQVPFELATIRQAAGKIVDAFAAEGDLDATAITSIEFEAEWPPRSGRRQSYPEAEEARWMTLSEARAMMLPSQLPLLDALEARLNA
jgi:predicted NUDIX family NTP pyrophosphohydrolase